MGRVAPAASARREHPRGELPGGDGIRASAACPHAVRRTRKRNDRSNASLGVFAGWSSWCGSSGQSATNKTVEHGDREGDFAVARRVTQPSLDQAISNGTRLHRRLSHLPRDSPRLVGARST